MYQNFIGIDISKNDFYVGIHIGNEVNSFPNSTKGFTAFHKTHRKYLENGLVVLETTGGYEKALIRYLQNKKYDVHRANTRKVKHFIRSYGCLGKSDSIDALGLARYGFERHTSLSLYEAPSDGHLRALVCRRIDLKRMIVQEKNRLQAPEKKSLKSSFMSVIEALKKEVKKLDEQIKKICEHNEKLQEQIAVLKSVPGIGEVVALQLITMMPELGKQNRKQIASLSGLAPHPNESGKKIGYRFTRGGRSTIKPILFMAAMAAARSQSKLGIFYQKLLAAGKKKMVALTALMRKIIVIANARMRDYYQEKDGPLATREMT